MWSFVSPTHLVSSAANRPKPAQAGGGWRVGLAGGSGCRCDRQVRGCGYSLIARKTRQAAKDDRRSAALRQSRRLAAPSGLCPRGPASGLIATRAALVPVKTNDSNEGSVGEPSEGGGGKRRRSSSAQPGQPAA